MSIQHLLPVSHPNFTYVGGALMIVILQHASTLNHTTHYQNVIFVVILLTSRSIP